MKMRSTKYRRVPFQTQSMGTQQLCLDIHAMYRQSCRLATAEGLGLLIDGNPGSSDRIDAVVRKCGATEADVTLVAQIGKALPRLPSLDFSDLALMANQFSELADDNGSWRRNFEQVAARLVDHKIAEIDARLDILEESLVSQFDFTTAIATLTELQRRWSHDVEQIDTSIWQPGFSDRLRHAADTYRRFATEQSQRPRWKRFRRGLSNDDRDQLQQQFDRDYRLAQQRVEQCKSELTLAIKKRLTHASNERSLAGRVRKLSDKCDRLHEMRSHLRKSVNPIEDTVTVTQLVKQTTEPIGPDQTLHDLINGAFEANGCGPVDVAARLRRGIAYRGAMLTPVGLANLEAIQAKQLLNVFSRSFFTDATDSVLAIDLTDEALQLPLAKSLVTVCEKANPYIRFMDIMGVEPIRETYLHCHRQVRPLVDAYRPGMVNFSNPETDQAFHLPERHVLTVTSNVLGPGHARAEYARARYLRDKMIGEGTFKSIYPFDQPMACPYALAERPIDERDSIALFELALKYDRIVSKKDSQGAIVYTVPCMDETIRFCFEVKIASRRIDDADHFIRLLEENWFADFVDSCVDSLPSWWHKDLINRLDSASSASIAGKMVSLGILERKSRSNRFRFAVPYSASRPLRSELYRITSATRSGIPKTRFIQKLRTVDELYTRILEDVISGEAMGNIPYRRLTAFAREQVDKRRRGAGL